MMCADLTPTLTLTLTPTRPQALKCGDVASAMQTYTELLQSAELRESEREIVERKVSEAARLLGGTYAT